MTTILIIDDDPAVLDVTARFLARQSYVVLLAPSGQAAINQADQADLVLLDATLEGQGSALPLAHELSTRLPVILTSGFDQSSFDWSGLYLAKPASFHDLLKVIEAADQH